MAASLNGMTLDEVAKLFADLLDEAKDEMIQSGMKGDEATRLIFDHLNQASWIAGNTPMR